MSNPVKNLRLIGILLLSFIAFVTALVLLFLITRFVFGLVNELPWITYIYTLFILSVPAFIFISVFTIFFRRTRTHPSKRVRQVSSGFFIIFIVAWIVIYILDVITFFQTSDSTIGAYKSWEVIVITASVACLFITSIIQALYTGKDEDWQERKEVE